MRIRVLALSTLVLFTGCVAALAERTIDVRKQSFPAAGILRARLVTGAGFLLVNGASGSSSIDVQAEFKTNSSEDPQRILEKMKLTMELRGDTFYLKTDEGDGWPSNLRGWIDITVSLPPSLEMEIEDGSGSLRVTGMDSDVRIEDGSGDIEVSRVRGTVRVEDGSGSIHVSDIGRDVEIEDGSGNVEVRHVAGNVRIEDGSGSIQIEDVKGDLDVPSAGSGSLNYRDVLGKIRVPKKR